MSRPPFFTDTPGHAQAPPASDPFNAEFASGAEEAAFAAGLTHGMRILSREESRVDGDPMRPRSNEASAAEAFDPSGLRLRHDGWLGWKKARFLEQLAAGAVVADACRSVGMSVASAYALRNRRSGRVFSLIWDAILIHRARARLAGETLSRAMNGCVDELRRDGIVVAERRRFDNRLSMAVLTRLDRLAESKTGEEAELLRSLSEDFEAYLDLVEEGGDEDAFLAARQPAAALAAPEPASEREPAREPGCDDRVWQDHEGEWWCAFPPPAGFQGREKGVYDGHAWYERTLTPAEQAVIDSRMDAVPAEDRAMRDNYFGFAGESASPSAQDGEGQWQPSTSSTSPPQDEAKGRRHLA